MHQDQWRRKYLDPSENPCKDHCCFRLKEELVPVQAREMEMEKVKVMVWGWGKEPQMWLPSGVGEVAAQRYAKGTGKARAQEMN